MHTGLAFLVGASCCTDGVGVSLFTRPPPRACPNGHPWGYGSGNVLIGTEPCTCPSAKAAGGTGHVWIRCKRCPYEWTDPPHDG